MTQRQIAWELEACRNERPTSESEIENLLSRIDAAGLAAAQLPMSKNALRLSKEASELSRKYRGLELPELANGVYIRA